MYSGITMDGNGTNMHATTITKIAVLARYRILAKAKPAAVLIMTMTTTAHDDTISELRSSCKIG